MGFQGSMFGSSNQPDQPIRDIRDMLFGDIPLEQYPPASSRSSVFAWDAFERARSHIAARERDGAIESWRRVLRHEGLETRHYLQAWHFLRTNGIQPPRDDAKLVLGVVVEVMLPEGLDLLAAYADHSARYFNFSGAAVVWDQPDASLNATIDELLETASIIVDEIGPWEEERLPAPEVGCARLNFLTPSGLHFGEGALNDLAADPLAGHVLDLATELMTALIGKTKAA